MIIVLKIKNVEKNRESCVPGAWVPSNKVPKLSQNVTPHLNQVLMAGRCLKCLQSMTTNATLSMLKRSTSKHNISYWPSSFTSLVVNWNSKKFVWNASSKTGSFNSSFLFLFLGIWFNQLHSTHTPTSEKNGFRSHFENASNCSWHHTHRHIDLQAHLKDCFGSIALDVVSIYYNLDDTVPHLLTDVITCDAD